MCLLRDALSREGSGPLPALPQTRDSLPTTMKRVGARVSNRDRGSAAELRAERTRWRERSHSLSQASRSMDERLRQMNGWASVLDGRLRRHKEESANWHRKWD